MVARRKKAIDYFLSQYGITEQEVLKLIAKNTVEQIGPDQIAVMLGIQQSLKDGDTTVDELLKDIRSKADKVKDILNGQSND